MNLATKTKELPAYILKIPQEILQEIVHLLRIKTDPDADPDPDPIADLDAFMGTCKQLYRIVSCLTRGTSAMFTKLPKNPPLMDLDQVALISKLESRKKSAIGRLISPRKESAIDKLISPKDTTIQGGIESSKKYRMLLCWAAGHGHTAAVKNLLDYGRLDKGQRDERGRDALWFAAANGHYKTVKQFVDMDGYNIDQPDTFGRTPLACAVQENHLSIVRLLLQTSRVNPNSMTNSKETPLIIAVGKGLADMVDELLKAENLNLDAGRLRGTGESALFLAAKHNYVDIYMSLLQSGKPVNILAPDENGSTLMHYLSGSGFDKSIRMLLESHEVDVDIEDDDGQTPLCKAVCENHISTCRILWEKAKANVNLGSGYMSTPLMIAARDGRNEILKFLLEECRADANEQGGSDESPLIKAAFDGNLEAVQLLLRNEANINFQDSCCGGTALHRVIGSYNDTQAVVLELLKHAHVNIELKDNDGRTPLSLAAYREDQKFATMLLDRGADIYSVDMRGMTPIDWAELRLGDGAWARYTSIFRIKERFQGQTTI
ncbi:ankyrin repeats (3 copies) domain-containing protein [Pochonia chlamydosporia 170]|uniref:Ankyrin repeats (3 copies) domain-containing protein n=1 Tax=Pochonia chlamydosporia 170 TaxID=1380566 RepID=A0A179FMU3_METCM|nr:ankyrin repeats (3 copies) domain-containing protein [Pochonia chlamydosporia 170]OAQ66339.1 ankyrin repeats (3 copies) domain-containing protein [Pochonia chlamydosporia 170]